MKDKKGIIITDTFQKILDESNRREAKSKGCKPSKIWVDKGSELYNRSMKSWLEKMIWKCIQRIMKENLLFQKDYENIKK